MSTERDVAPLLRSWFRSEPDGSVDHLIDAILGEVDATPQRRSTWWPARRYPEMNAITKFGIAAAVLAVTLAMGYGLWQNIGNVVPDPQPSENPVPQSGPLPADLRHIFIGATRDVPGLEVDDRLVLDLTGQVLRVHTGIGGSGLISAASVESGALRFESASTATECAEGDVGRYPYSFSPGRTVLTIGTGTDDCAPRANALVGEWRRSACLDPENWCLGELEAGRQTSLFFDPYRAEFEQAVTRHGALTYEVPDGWANADDRTHFYTLTRAGAYQESGVMGCLDCPDNIWLGANPRAVRMDCSEEVADEAIGASAEALADWIRANPGLQIIEGPAITVDGRQTFVLDIMASEDYADACVDPELDRSLVPLFTHPGYTYAIGTGDRHRLLLVEIDADTAMLIGIDTLDPADIDAFAVEIQPIVDSISLTAP